MCCTDFLQVYWSLYFDHWMKNIVHKVVPLYVKSAEILIDDWLTHSFPNKLPPGSILFIYMHFISMYSNIDTEYGIQVVRDYILPKISRRYPKWLPHWSLTSQQKKSCSLVLKVKKLAALFFRVLTGIHNTVYCAACFFFKMYQVLFSTRGIKWKQLQ